MDNVNEIYVYENWKSDTPSLIGTLYVEGGRGNPIFMEIHYHLMWILIIILLTLIWLCRLLKCMGYQRHRRWRN